MDTLNSFAPIKKKYAPGNQMPFMTKNLSKEIMTRSRLRNKYLKHKTEENRLLYTQQRNKCVSLLRKTKMNYYGNLNEKDITDNKKFWKTVKPFLSDKSINSDKIHLNENGELINSKTKTAEVLNEFFSNIVKNLKIPEYENLNRNFQKVKDPVLKAILKYKNHPSIIAIKEKSKNSKFTFHEVDNERIIKEIKSLNKNKASQKSDIPITIIHENADIFADFLAESLKGAIKTYNFTILHLYIKKGERTTRKTTDRLVFYQLYLKYYKEYFLSKYQFTLISFYKTNNADFEKDIVRNI